MHKQSCSPLKIFNEHVFFHPPLLVWWIWRAEMCLSHWSICLLDGGFYPSRLWHCNKWRGGGVTGGWRSSSYTFFNLPDASQWQRLITRWHCAVMVTLTHLLLGGEREWRWTRLMCVCVYRLTDPVLPLLPPVKVFLRVLLLSLAMRSPAAWLIQVHHRYQYHGAQQRVRVGPC